jgi:hypothetical protein
VRERGPRTRPAFTATTGLTRVIREAISRKRRGLPKFSTYISTASMPGSCSQASSRSLTLTSGLLPTDTNWAMPIPYSRA